MNQSGYQVNSPGSLNAERPVPLTSYRLTRRAALPLCLLTLLFAALADYFLYQTLVSKDRSLLQARLVTYQRISQHAGIAKLTEVIAQEALDPELWLVEIPAVGYSNQTTATPPDNKTPTAQSTPPRLNALHWPVINTTKKRWLMVSGGLSTPVSAQTAPPCIWG